MSRPYYAPKQVYVGNGSVDAYTFDFKIEAKTQLLVVVMNALDVEVQRLRGDDATFIDSVTFDPILGGGTVNLLANLATGYRIGLFLDNEEPSQNYEFANKTSFSLKRLESALDFIVGPLQRLSLLTKQSFRIHDMDDETSFDTQLPPGITDSDNYNRTFAINEDGTGLKLGPTTDTIDGAATAAASAAASAADALAAEIDAETAAAAAAVSEANTTFYANLFLFEDFIQVDDTDSPVGPVVNGALYLSDDTDGDVDFELPPLASVDENWKAAVIKQSPSLQVLNIIPDGSDTINNNPTFAATQQGIGCVFFKESPTNWSIRYFAFTESTGINPLPPGGAEGAALVKNSATDDDVKWEALAYAGYSSRFSETVSLNGLKEVLDYILAITYLGPLIASFTGSSNTLREKGTSVSGITLSVNVTKRSNDIARILFKQNGVAFEDLNPPSNTGSGVTNSSVSVTAFTDTRSFQVEVTDEVVGPDGGNMVSSTVTYNFVYPYYYGAGVAGKTAAQVAALNKVVMVESTSYVRTFTMSNGDVFYLAYLASYGNLVSILDENGFETFSSWTKTTSNITGLDGNAVSYNIYEYNNPVVAGSTFFTFKQ